MSAENQEGAHPRGKPAAAEINAAVAASGYLMEQEVASRFEALGYHVQTNRAYLDQDEEKSREYDLSAVKRVHHDEIHKISVFIEFIVECKSSYLPYIFISRNKNSVDNNYSPREIAFSINEYERTKAIGGGRSHVKMRPAFFEMGLEASHHYFTSEQKFVQFCRVERKGSGWIASHAGMYESILIPLIKAFEARRSSFPKTRREGEYSYVWIYVPTVIVRGEMYKINSNISGNSPESAQHITLQREIKSKQFDNRYLLEFVNEFEIENFVNHRIESLATAVCAAIEASPVNFLNPKRAWVEA